MTLGGHGDTDDERVIRSFTPREVTVTHRKTDERAGIHESTPAIAHLDDPTIEELFTQASSHAYYLRDGRRTLLQLRNRAEDARKIMKLRRLAAIKSGVIEGAKNEQTREAMIASWLSADPEYQEAIHEDRACTAAADELEIDVDLDHQMLRLYRAGLFALGGTNGRD